MSKVLPTAFLCNGASLPANLVKYKPKPLNYLSSDNGQSNVRLGLPDFVRSVYYLPPRCLDLLEIAAYVFAGDRLMSRGRTDAVEYHGWERDMQFVIRVRDYDFWIKPAVTDALEKSLTFMTGDKAWRNRFSTWSFHFSYQSFRSRGVSTGDQHRYFRRLVLRRVRFSDGGG